MSITLFLDDAPTIDSDFYHHNSNFIKLKKFRIDQCKINIAQSELLSTLEKLHKTEIKAKSNGKRLRKYIRKNPLPSDFLSDAVFMKKLINFKWYFIHAASDSFRDDREIMKELIKKKQVLFRYASERLRSDRELLELALDISDLGNNLFKVWEKLSHALESNDGMVGMFRWPTRIFKYCTDESLRYNRELRKKAMEIGNNRELIKEAVRYHGAILVYIDVKYMRDTEIVLDGLYTSPDRLWRVPSDIRNGLDFALQVAERMGNRWKFETYFKSFGEDFWRVAIEKRFLSTTLLVTNIYNDKKLMEVVLGRDGSLLELCSDEIRDDVHLVRIAIANNVKNIKYASQRIKSCDESASFLIGSCPLVISYLDDSIRENPKYYQMISNPENLKVFQSAPYCIRNNAEIAEFYAGWNAYGIFLLVSDELKNNRDFVWKIFSLNASILQNASEELRNDLNFMRLCIGKNPLQFCDLSESLRGNIEMITLAVETALDRGVSAREIRSSIIVKVTAKEKDKHTLIEIYRKCMENHKHEDLLYFAFPILLFDLEFVIKESMVLNNKDFKADDLFRKAVSSREYIVAAAILLSYPSIDDSSFKFSYYYFPRDLAPNLFQFLEEKHMPLIIELFLSKAAPVSLFGGLPESIRYSCAKNFISHKLPILEFIPNHPLSMNELCTLLPIYSKNEEKIMDRILEYSNDRNFFETILNMHYDKFSQLIKYASETLRNDFDLMEKFIRYDRSTLQYASDLLKNNRDLVSLAVKLLPMSFEFASYELRNDFEFVNSIPKLSSAFESSIFSQASKSVRMKYLQTIRSKQ